MRKETDKLRSQKKSIGFVPTMGCLHEGHFSLVRRSKQENDVTVLSIFVNPTQFGLGEDFAKYPRDKKNDVLLAIKNGVDIIFYPSVKKMYPERYLTYITVEKLSDGLCGARRPTHFRGVTTIVGKLLNIISPQRMYLGQKDAQQVAILKQMIYDLHIPVKVLVGATIRETDGLALSSRNKYLSPQERVDSPLVFQALCMAKEAIRRGQRKPTVIQEIIKTHIKKSKLARIDYVECVDATTLLPVKHIHQTVLIAVAVFFGKARLIDNIVIDAK